MFWKKTVSDPYIELHELAKLPRWPSAAFASRCARRASPVLPATGLAGHEAVGRLLGKIDECVRRAAELSEREVFELVDEVDDQELEYRGNNDDAHRVACHLLSSAKFAAFCIIEDSTNVAKNAWDAYRNAVQAACYSANDDPDEAITNSEVTYAQMRRDFETLNCRVASDAFDDQTLVDDQLFGEMWPTTTPTWAHGSSRWDEIK